MLPINFPILNFAALAPELVVLGTAAVVMIAELFVKDKRVLGYISLLGLLLAIVPCVMMLNAAAVPIFQNMAASDGFSLVLNLIFIVTAVLSVLVALGYLDGKGLQHGEYYALLLFATVGMMLMGAATDLIVIFMALEIMSIALYILAAFNWREPSSGEAGMKYFVLGAFASAFFLYGAALVYGAVDASGGFFQAAVAMPWRSPVNVCFRLGQAELTDHFVAESEAAGLHYLRGHPQLGGLRASLYNALPEAGAAALADFMIDFQRRWG